MKTIKLTPVEINKICKLLADDTKERESKIDGCIKLQRNVWEQIISDNNYLTKKLQAAL